MSEIALLFRGVGLSKRKRGNIFKDDIQDALNVSVKMLSDNKKLIGLSLVL